MEKQYFELETRPSDIIAKFQEINAKLDKQIKMKKEAYQRIITEMGENNYTKNLG